MTTNIDEIIKKTGGRLMVSLPEMTKKVNNIKVILFDWDGVFNPGMKGPEMSNGFSEIDSMGIQLVRFGHWLENKDILFTGIITGQRNESAIYMAEREHFDAVYYLFKDKKEALDIFEKEYKFKPEEIAFVFDDVLDLAIAKYCGLRFFIKRDANPVFNEFVVQNNFCDYMSGQQATTFAVREICELMLAIKGNFDTIMNHRIDYSTDYQKYSRVRSEIKPRFYSGKK